MRMARGLNMRRVLLEVRPSNTAALGLYCNMGFREIGLRRGYYPAVTPARGTPKVGNPHPAGGWAELTPPPDTHPAGGLGADKVREDAIVMECIL